MKKSTISLMVATTLSASFLLSGCDEKTQDQAKISVAKSEINLEKHQEVTESQLAKVASDSAAHWLTPQLLVLPKINKPAQHYLLITTQAGIESVALAANELPDEIIKQNPHLADFQGYKINASAAQAKEWLKYQLRVVTLDKQGQVQHLSYVQTATVIDALYTQGANDADEVTDFGATMTEQGVQFKLWAPTAQNVELLLFKETDNEITPILPNRLAMVEDPITGGWSVTGDHLLKNAYYQYQITLYHPESKQVETLVTTDPYSLSLSVNSKYSQVVDLNDSETQPKGWVNHQVPSVKQVEDNIFYEVHIRDFSSDDHELSNTEFRGKYKAFSEQKSAGILHLKALNKAGLNNIHLLPTYDLATINEDENQVVDINDTVEQVKIKVCATAPNLTLCQGEYKEGQSLKSLLASFDVSGDQAQKIVSELRQFDNFNWGYDPFHYTVPEGSYALNPQGKNRLVEFREMVQSIHELGFRVIMDVVYNHTYQFGLKEKSVLDKVVPNYYHRLNITTGEVEQSTCYTCGNTATERVMMAKLMSDSLVVWARDYKIDGFRFDLMGHQSKAAMLAAREAVRAVDNDTYFYGEGWNFGEVANNSRFVQASQLELGGTEIGTFSDRLRDAVRGGGNNTRDSQGIGNGLLMLPNDKQSNELASKEQNLHEYQLRMDQLRVGLAGNLVNFPLYKVNDKQVLGKDIPYGDQPTGYALDPADTINYVSKHDNQTLWDNSQYRLPFDVSTDDRVRMHLQSLSFTLFAQGIPFLHMGSEFMRSKSFLRDSYDYGDWFNRVDFTKQHNYYNIGLPPADKDQENWPLIKSVLKGHQGRDQVNANQIIFSAKVFEEMLALRMSSLLFRLTTAEAIIDKVSFYNTKNEQLGLLVMKLDDTQGQPVDEVFSSLMVIFNTSTTTQTFVYAGANKYQLHPIQQHSIDEKVKQSKTSEQGFTVPPLTSVVFVKKRK